VLYATSSWAYRLTHRHRRESRFRPTRRDFHQPPSAACSRKRFDPLVSFAPLQSASRPEPAPRLSTWDSCRGVCHPSSRHQSAASVRRGSIPAAFPSSTFLASTTACSAADLAGLFRPAATSRVHSSGVSPPAQPRDLVGDACPLVVGDGPLPAMWPPAPRPAAPPSGPSIQARVRCSHDRFSRRSSSVPS